MPNDMPLGMDPYANAPRIHPSSHLLSNSGNLSPIVTLNKLHLVGTKYVQMLTAVVCAFHK
jgi:hypothetical protein